jgi:hypothetical protein
MSGAAAPPTPNPRGTQLFMVGLADSDSDAPARAKPAIRSVKRLILLCSPVRLQSHRRGAGAAAVSAAACPLDSDLHARGTEDSSSSPRHDCIGELPQP